MSITPYQLMQLMKNPQSSLFLLFLPVLPTTYAQFAGLFDSPDLVPQLPPIPSQLSISANVPSTVASAVAAEATLVAHQNSIGISSGTPNASLPDPCGPAVQSEAAAANISSTCNKAVSTNDTDPLRPSHYGVSCQHCDGSSGHQVPNITTCENEMIAICYTMSAAYGAAPTDQWVHGNSGGNCTLGFWLPEGGAPPPSYARCVDQIFELIADTCLEPKYNVGSVNLAKLPDMQAFNVSAQKGTFYTGLPVDAGYPSYIMLAQQSSND